MTNKLPVFAILAEIDKLPVIATLLVFDMFRTFVPLDCKTRFALELVSVPIVNVEPTIVETFAVDETFRVPDTVVLNNCAIFIS